jgi:hypothetical protein
MNAVQDCNDLLDQFVGSDAGAGRAGAFLAHPFYSQLLGSASLTYIKSRGRLRT